jgi:hypothetical protein
MDLKLTIDYEKINRGFVDLEKASNTAARNTLNVMAALTRRNYIANAGRDLILRNNFTQRNIKFDKAEGDYISLMKAEVGATVDAKYMELQEEGGIRKPKGGSSLPIAQDSARGGSIKRPVARNYYLRSLKRKIVHGKFKKNIHSKKAITVARAYVAFKKKKFLRYSNNIYLVTSFNKSKNKIKFKMNHIYNLSQKSATINSNPMLLPATEQPVKDAQNIYNSQMDKLLRSKEII